MVALGLARLAIAPMEAQESLTLVAGSGVLGDRYAAGGGTWAGWPDAEVTLFESEVADALGLPPLAARRNVVTRGVRLDALVGREFTVGPVRLAGVRPCDPCAHLARLLDRPGLVQALSGGRGGLRARVVEGGVVRLGETVLEHAPRLD